MAYVDFKRGYVRFKLVYYGPEQSGKTANLEYLSKLGDEPEGIIQLGGENEEVGSFEHLPLNLGRIRSIDTMLRIYTVPGSEQFNQTRQMVLKDVDGIVFVVDSDPEKLDDNITCLQDLEENLLKRNVCLFDLPLVVQYNKRDLKNALPVSELESHINPYSWRRIESTATTGDGIMDTLNLITQLIYEQTASKYSLVPSTPPALIANDESELIEEESEPNEESEQLEVVEPEPDDEESKPALEAEPAKPEPDLEDPKEPSLLFEVPSKLEQVQSEEETEIEKETPEKTEKKPPPLPKQPPKLPKPPKKEEEDFARESELEMMELKEDELEEQVQEAKRMPPLPNKLSRKVAAHIIKSIPAPPMLPKAPPSRPMKKPSSAKSKKTNMKSLLGKLESNILKRMDLLEVCMQHLDKKHDKLTEEFQKLGEAIELLNTKIK